MPNPGWFKNRLQDPFFRKAHRENYRSRAVYKLQEIQEKYQLIRSGQKVLDLGAAPGSWTQYAVQEAGKNGKVIGIDLLPIQPLDGASLLEGDVRDPVMQEQLRAFAPKGFDLILSDMAPNTTGVHHADASNSVELVHLALDLCKLWLKPGGSFVAKVFEGTDFKELHERFKKLFGFAKSFKPKASLAASRETYLVGREFKWPPPVQVIKLDKSDPDGAPSSRTRK